MRKETEGSERTGIVDGFARRVDMATLDQLNGYGRIKPWSDMKSEYEKPNEPHLAICLREASEKMAVEVIEVKRRKWRRAVQKY